MLRQASEYAKLRSVNRQAARSVIDLSHIVQRLEEKKVDLVVFDQGIDTTTIYGKLQFHILAAIRELERGLIRERSREGRQRAIDQGVVFGAGPKLTGSGN
jgi:DNA invertase Pin-like site-specific DNA recombinase